jgi:hypothetical protein
MAKLIDIHMNTGLTEWDSTETDGGHLSWAAAAGLPNATDNPGGMSCLIADTNDMYALKSVTTNTSGKLRARLYFDINSITMANLDVVTLWYARSTTLPTFVNIQAIKIGANYTIFASIVDDTATANDTGYVTITDAPHYIEVYVQRAATDISADGRLDLWVDGGSQETVASIDNYDRFGNFSYCLMGVISPPAGTSGTVYLDELAVNDDGAEIGAAPTVLDITVDATNTAYNNYGVKIRSVGDLF